MMQTLLPLELRAAHRWQFAQSQGKRVETRALRADGTEFPAEVSVSRVFEDPPVFTWFVRDITERRRSERRAEWFLRRLSALRTTDIAINSSLDLRVTLDVLLEQVTSQLQVDAADVLVLNPHTHELEYAASRGFKTGTIARSRLRLGQGYAGAAAAERRIISLPLFTDARPAFAQSALVTDEGFVSYCAAADLTVAYDTTIEGWSRALDLRDRDTEGHTIRVTEVALELARAVGIREDDLAHVHRGGLLHDIGKIAIPDSILLKPGPLTDDEWDIMRRHPVYAHELLSPVAHLRPALDIPYAHHEKWDGTGYPRGLKGEEIPLAARTFAVVDVWDALRSNRPYRAAWSELKTRKYIRDQAGTHFDPAIAKVFLDLPATPGAAIRRA